MTTLIHTSFAISSTSSSDLVLYVGGQSSSFTRSNKKANPDLTLLDEGVSGFSCGSSLGTN